MREKKLDPSKQYLKISVSKHTTPLWKLFVRFSVDIFGPNFKFWGKIANEKAIEIVAKKFEKFYKQERKEFPNSTEGALLMRDDVIDMQIYAELLNAKSIEEEKKIDIYFQNLNALFQKQRYHGPERMICPPLEAYIYVGHNRLNIGPNRERDVVISGQD